VILTDCIALRRMF